MNILYIVQHFSGYSGSGSVRAYEFSRRLAGNGHRVTLLCGTSERSVQADVDELRRDNVNVIQSPICYSQGLSYAARMVKFVQYMNWSIRAGKSLPRPDVVFASSTPLTVGEVGRAVAAYHRVTFVFEVRDLWPEVPISLGVLNNPLLKFAARRLATRIYSAAAHVVALSPEMRDGVRAWGVPEPRISVIPNCSNPSLFKDKSKRVQYRELYRVGNDLFCVHPGAMGIVNGLDYLLDCGKLLDKWGCRGIRIALIGDGTQKRRLMERISAERISCVTVHESIEKSCIPSLLSAADVGLMCVTPNPTLQANSANKFFDYLSAGLPIVINYGGWQAMTLRAGQAGLSVSSVEPGEMARALMTLRDTPRLRQEMAAGALKLAEGPYNIDELTRELEGVLLRMVA